MAKFARVKLKAAPHTESVIPVKGYELLKKKYTLIGYEDGDGGELTEVQKLMEQKKADKKKAAEAAGGDENPKGDTNSDTTKPVTEVDQELEDLREQYEAKFGKPADKRMKADKLKAKLNEA